MQTAKERYAIAYRNARIGINHAGTHFGDSACNAIPSALRVDVLEHAVKRNLVSKWRYQWANIERHRAFLYRKLLRLGKL